MKVNKVVLILLLTGFFTCNLCFGVEKQGVRVTIFLDNFLVSEGKSSSGEKVIANSGENLRLKKDNKVGAVTGTLINAISSDVEMIVANNVLVGNLLTLKKIENAKLSEQDRKRKRVVEDFFDKINTKRFVYATADKRFVIFLKVSDPTAEKIKWNKLGLKKPVQKNIITSEEKLNKLIVDPMEEALVMWKKIESERPQQELGKELKKINMEFGIDINSLIGIFEGDAKKFVLINGHGVTGTAGKKLKQLAEEMVIAQLTQEQNLKLLEHMNKTGCLFMYYMSCYSGGLNLKLIDKKVDESAKVMSDKIRPIGVSFPIVAGSSADVAQSALDFADFNAFFENLDKFFARRVPEKGISPQYDALIEKPFREIVRPLAGKYLANIPTVLLPGFERPVKVIKVDDRIIVLTYPYLIAHELKNVKIRGKKLADLITVIESGPEEETLAPEEQKKELERIRKKMREINEKLKRGREAEGKGASQLSEKAKKAAEKEMAYREKMRKGQTKEKKVVGKKLSPKDAKKLELTVQHRHYYRQQLEMKHQLA